MLSLSLCVYVYLCYTGRWYLGEHRCLLYRRQNCLILHLEYTLSQRLSLFLSLAPYLSLSLSLPFLQSKMMKLFIEKVVVVK